MKSSSQDLVQLVNADQPLWLQGIVEMTRTFGLELLETLLSSYSPVFYKFQPFQALLKERVCQLVIKLFSPNIKVKCVQKLCLCGTISYTVPSWQWRLGSWTIASCL